MGVRARAETATKWERRYLQARATTKVVRTILTVRVRLEASVVIFRRDCLDVEKTV